MGVPQTEWLSNQVRTQAKWNHSKAIVLNRLIFRGYRGFALFTGS